MGASPGEETRAEEALDDKFPTNQKSGEEGGDGGCWYLPPQVTPRGDGALQEAEPAWDGQD